MNINGPCFSMMRFSWRSLMIAYINFNLIVWTFNSNSRILLVSLKTLFLWLFYSSWVVIYFFILYLCLIFDFLFVFIILIFSLFIVCLLNRMLFSLIINFLLFLLFHYLMLPLRSFNSLSLITFEPFLLVKKGLTNLFCKIEINRIISDKSSNSFSAIIYSWKLNE